ncbi:MAG: hypothetical protein HC945_00900 [Nitrosarchaeum sp.]|nr:hypothetical protein [Nitrosarchaeum sp.]
MVRRRDSLEGRIGRAVGSVASAAGRGMAAAARAVVRHRSMGKRRLDVLADPILLGSWVGLGGVLGLDYVLEQIDRSSGDFDQLALFSAGVAAALTVPKVVSKVVLPGLRRVSCWHEECERRGQPANALSYVKTLALAGDLIRNCLYCRYEYDSAQCGAGRKSGGA